MINNIYMAKTYSGTVSFYELETSETFTYSFGNDCSIGMKVSTDEHDFLLDLPSGLISAWNDKFEIAEVIDFSLVQDDGLVYTCDCEEEEEC